jgi:8-oxo-dGTP pyrophosphatase MutT (NUDIX family)
MIRVLYPDRVPDSSRCEWEHGAMAVWQRRGPRQTLALTPRLRVHRDPVIDPGGARCDYDHVATADLVRVVALVDDAVLLIEQHHYLPDRMVLQCPGGNVDDGESADDATVRELAEETGYRAATMTALTALWPMPGLSAARTHCFLAEDLTATGSRGLESGEADARLVAVAIVDLPDAVRAGRIGCAPSTAALLLATGLHR